MNCTKCGWDHAYIGFNSVECRNPECVHYVKAEEPVGSEGPRLPETPPTPGWSHWLSSVPKIAEVLGITPENLAEQRANRMFYRKEIAIGPNTSPLMAMMEDFRKLSVEEVAALAKYFWLEEDTVPAQEYVLQTFRTAKE